MNSIVLAVKIWNPILIPIVSAYGQEGTKALLNIKRKLKCVMQAQGEEKKSCLGKEESTFKDLFYMVLTLSILHITFL